MKAIQFPSFRAAAKFFQNSQTSYDEACVIVKRQLANKTLVIGKTKTDVEAVASFASFAFVTWVVFVSFFAFCFAVQVQTACPLWILFSFMGAMSLVWLVGSINFAKIVFVDTIRYA